MKTNITEEQKYLNAKKKVEKIKGFYSHLLVYFLVISFLIFINLYTSPQYKWFWFPMIGWGIGIVSHAYGIFNHNLILGDDWEKRKIKELMDKDDKQYWEQH